MTASIAPKGHPTVLVAEDDMNRHTLLASSLRQEGYLVLEAHDCAGILDIIRTHSRAIHLLLINASTNNRTVADRLKGFRPEMRVLFVGQPQHEAVSDVVTPETALAKVREFFGNREATPLVGRERGVGIFATRASQSVPPARLMKAAG
jgi:CheY-like chemotaxis protein